MSQQWYAVFSIFRFLPKAKHVNTLIANTKEVISHLDARLDKNSVLYGAFQSLNTLYETEAQKLAPQQGQLTDEDWNKKSDKEKIQTYGDINKIRQVLVGLDSPGIRAGSRMLAIFMAILIFFGAGYVMVHSPPASDLAAKGAGKSGQAESASDVISGTRMITVVKSELNDVPAAQDTDLQWQEVEASFQKLAGAMNSGAVSHRTKRYAGELGGYITARKLVDAQASLKELDKALADDQQEQPGSYFWTTGPKRWLEIIAWSFFGVLVGVIFYLAQQLKMGTFNQQDIPSMISEVVIAPFVTCVIFFLFSYTGITEFSPTNASIFLVLGFAFLFGYAIRRTVGLLDNIKRRILPDP